MAMRDEVRFEYHRGVAPMMWVFASLAVIELLVVHLLVSLKWPAFAWWLSAVTAVGVVWLIFWIRSFRRFPHSLSGNMLTLHIGSLRSLTVAVGNVAEVHSSWPPGTLAADDVVNIVPLAHPNRLIELKAPIKSRKGPASHVALRVDDPAAFDEAISAAMADLRRSR